MPLVNLIVVLIVVGVVWYLIETYLPIAEPFKIVIRVVIVLVLCIWLLQAFGIIGPNFPVLR